MSLKEIEANKRIDFLRFFTYEILINAYKKRKEKIILESEKLKRQFLEPKTSSEHVLSNFLRDKSQLKPGLRPLVPKRFVQKPAFLQQKTFKPNQETSLKSLRPGLPELKYKSTTDIIKSIGPEVNPRPVGLSLGKIDLLLKDRAIQSIECNGPNKELLIKKYDQINKTRLSLTKEEIFEVLNKFSKEAKIPILGGIFKAAIGDLVISAVLSDEIGSRFVINKITN
jgi:hypothetical protein